MRLIEMYGRPIEPTCALERVLYESAGSLEEYADSATLHERAVWCIKLNGYTAKIRRHGAPYSCGFFHDDTAYIARVRERYATPYDPGLLHEKSAFVLGFTEAYHGSEADGGEIWLTWVKAALFGPA